MGIDYTAVCGFGVILDVDKFKTKSVKVPSCYHAEREGHKFCPTCGIKVDIHEEEVYGFAEQLNELFFEKKFTKPQNYFQ